MRAWPSVPFLPARSLSPRSIYRLSLELNHVQVVERHKVSVTSEDVHVALGVDDRDVAIAGRGLSASNQAKFVLVVVCRIMVEPAKLLPLLHLLMVLVEALVGVLNNERVHHCNRRRSA